MSSSSATPQPPTHLLARMYEKGMTPEEAAMSYVAAQSAIKEAKARYARQTKREQIVENLPEAQRAMALAKGIIAAKPKQLAMANELLKEEALRKQREAALKKAQKARAVTLTGDEARVEEQRRAENLIKNKEIVSRREKVEKLRKQIKKDMERAREQYFKDHPEAKLKQDVIDAQRRHQMKTWSKLGDESVNAFEANKQRRNERLDKYIQMMHWRSDEWFALWREFQTNGIQEVHTDGQELRKGLSTRGYMKLTIPGESVMSQVSCMNLVTDKRFEITPHTQEDTQAFVDHANELRVHKDEEYDLLNRMNEAMQTYNTETEFVLLIEMNVDPWYPGEEIVYEDPFKQKCVRPLYWWCVMSKDNYMKHERITSLGSLQTPYPRCVTCGNLSYIFLGDGKIPNCQIGECQHASQLNEHKVTGSLFCSEHCKTIHRTMDHQKKSKHGGEGNRKRKKLEKKARLRGKGFTTGAQAWDHIMANIIYNVFTSFVMLDEDVDEDIDTWIADRLIVKLKKWIIDPITGKEKKQHTKDCMTGLLLPELEDAIYDRFNKSFHADKAHENMLLTLMADPELPHRMYGRMNSMAEVVTILLNKVQRISSVPRLHDDVLKVVLGRVRFAFNNSITNIATSFSDNHVLVYKNGKPDLKTVRAHLLSRSVFPYNTSQFNVLNERKERRDKHTPYWAIQNMDIGRFILSPPPRQMSYAVELQGLMAQLMDDKKIVSWMSGYNPINKQDEVRITPHPKKSKIEIINMQHSLQQELRVWVDPDVEIKQIVVDNLRDALNAERFRLNAEVKASADAQQEALERLAKQDAECHDRMVEIMRCDLNLWADNHDEDKNNESIALAQEFRGLFKLQAKLKRFRDILTLNHSKLVDDTAKKMAEITQRCKDMGITEKTEQLADGSTTTTFTVAGIRTEKRQAAKQFLKNARGELKMKLKGMSTAEIIEFMQQTKE